MANVEIDTLHTPFANFLEGQGIPFVRARWDQKSGIALGHPDFTILSHGRNLLIEFKTKEKGLSADQKRRIAVLEASGNTVHVLRDLDKAVRLVVEWRNSMGPPDCNKHASGHNGNGHARPGNLVRFGAGVFQRDPTTGALSRVRTATAEDLLLPRA